jgi:hypothetical protein
MPNLSSLVNPASSVITNSASQPVPTTVSDATVALEEIAYYLGKLVKMSESSAVVDTAQRQRVAVEAFSPQVVISGGTIRLTNNSNQNLISVGANTYDGIVYGAIPEVWRTMDIARQNFQASIRSNLQFS